MEYRELPTVAASEPRPDGASNSVSPRVRVRRLDAGPPERPTLGARDGRSRFRQLLLISVTLGLLGLAAGQAVEWLRSHPSYHLAFHQIELRPEPPSWIRGGRAGFLEQVRAAAGEPKLLPLLRLETGQVERALKLSPWVEEVFRVEYPFRRVAVRLQYKHPVAWVGFPQGRQYLLDRTGHVLPIGDVDPSKLPPLVRITGTGIAPPVEPAAGRLWKSAVDAAEGRLLDARILQAARLASRLTDAGPLADAQQNPALRIVAIVATDPRGLFLQNAEATMILWGTMPDDEHSANEEFSEKWRILKKWAEHTSPRILPRGDFWVFEGDAMRSEGPGSHRRSQRTRGEGGSRG